MRDAQWIRARKPQADTAARVLAAVAGAIVEPGSNPAALELLAALRELNARWAKGCAWLAGDPGRAERATGRFREIADEAAAKYDELDALAPELLAGFELFPETDEDRAAAATPYGSE